MPTAQQPFQPLPWLLGRMGQEIDLSITQAEAGLILDGVAIVSGFTDVGSDREPGAAWLDVRTHPLAPPLRLWLNFNLVIGVHVDLDTDDLLLQFAGELAYVLRPIYR
jgi:hypothetical protein